MAAEQRLKGNAAVFAYWRAKRLEDTKVVLVREFRTPGAADDGYVRERPAGSGLAGMADPRAVVAEEFTEETGLAIDSTRLRAHHARQVAVTVSTHRSPLLSFQLNAAELDELRSDVAAQGATAESERRYVENARLGDLLMSATVGWNTLGAITQVLLANESLAAADAGEMQSTALTSDAQAQTFRRSPDSSCRTERGHSHPAGRQAGRQAGRAGRLTTNRAPGVCPGS